MAIRVQRPRLDELPYATIRSQGSQSINERFGLLREELMRKRSRAQPDITDGAVQSQHTASDKHSKSRHDTVGRSQWTYAATEPKPTRYSDGNSLETARPRHDVYPKASPRHTRNQQLKVKHMAPVAAAAVQAAASTGHGPRHTARGGQWQNEAASSRGPSKPVNETRSVLDRVGPRKPSQGPIGSSKGLSTGGLSGSLLGRLGSATTSKNDREPITARIGQPIAVGNQSGGNFKKTKGKNGDTTAPPAGESSKRGPMTVQSKGLPNKDILDDELSQYMAAGGTKIRPIVWDEAEL